MPGGFEIDDRAAAHAARDLVADAEDARLPSSTRATKQQIFVVPMSSAAIRLPRGRAKAGGGFARHRPLALTRANALAHAVMCSSPHERPFLVRRLLRRLRGIDPQHEPVGQPHIDGLHVAFQNGARCAPVGELAPGALGVRLPGAGRRSHHRCANSSGDRRPGSPRVTRASEIGLGSPACRSSAAAWRAASSPTTIGRLAKRSRSVDRDHRALAVDQLLSLPPCCQTASGWRSTRRT